MTSVLKHFGYLLCLAGATFAGFPPPRLFEREESPEEAIVRVLEEDFTPDQADGVLSEWGLRVKTSSSGVSGPSEPGRAVRPQLHRLPRPFAVSTARPGRFKTG
jgi:hypothetical protein